MTLDEYLKTTQPATDMARALGVPPALLSQWRTGARAVPAERCIQIERVTNGAVRCEDLRPDVNWGFLRHTDCPLHQEAA